MSGFIARRKKTGLQCAMIFTLALVSISAWSTPGIHVIGNISSASGHPEMTLLVNIFNRRIRVDDQGQAYVPVNLPANHPLRKLFSVILFGQKPESMERYWNEQYFKGISPPYVLSSMEAVRRFVASTPGAIGYVLDCGVNEDREVLLNIPLTTDQFSLLSSLCKENP